MFNFYFILNINIINCGFLFTKQLFLSKTLCDFNDGIYKTITINNLKNIKLNKKTKLSYTTLNNCFLKVISFLYINNLNTLLFIFNNNGFCNKVLYNFNYVNVIYYLYFFKNNDILCNYFLFMKSKKKIIIGIDIEPIIIKYIVKLNLIFLDISWFINNSFIIFFIVNYYFLFKKNFLFLNSFNYLTKYN